VRIPEKKEKIKLVRQAADFLRRDDVFAALLIASVGIAAFALGNAHGKSVERSRGGEIRIFWESESEKKRENEVVASKNGRVYHYPWCPGASRIRPENVVRFSSPAAAKKAGLRPALNCPGL